MKKILTILFVIYTAIGLLLTPFIRSNNAYAYRHDISKATGWGRSIGNAFYWPSYLFSIEPELDGSNATAFQDSIVEIAKYRDKKLYVSEESMNKMSMAIGICILRDEASDPNGKSIDGVRESIMDLFDGYDFADIMQEGYKCDLEILRSEG